MPSKSKVYFFFKKVHFSFTRRNELKNRIERIFKAEDRQLSALTYVFCADREILAINRQFLKHDYYTDIISFDLTEKKGPIIGEIYISVDRVRDNARKLNIPFSHELRRVIFHGALHLCGYGDKTSAEKAKMREKEDFYLADRKTK